MKLQGKEKGENNEKRKRDDEERHFVLQTLLKEKVKARLNEDEDDERRKKDDERKKMEQKALKIHKVVSSVSMFYQIKKRRKMKQLMKQDKEENMRLWNYEDQAYGQQHKILDKWRFLESQSRKQMK